MIREPLFFGVKNPFPTLFPTPVTSFLELSRGPEKFFNGIQKCPNNPPVGCNEMFSRPIDVTY
jgi:hypothetical protein